MSFDICVLLLILPVAPSLNFGEKMIKIIKSPLCSVKLCFDDMILPPAFTSPWRQAASRVAGRPARPQASRGDTADAAHMHACRDRASLAAPAACVVNDSRGRHAGLRGRAYWLQRAPCMSHRTRERDRRCWPAAAPSQNRRV